MQSAPKGIENIYWNLLTQLEMVENPKQIIRHAALTGHWKYLFHF